MENPVGYYRRLRGMTQKQLADASGVSFGALLKLENGQRKIMSAQLGTVLQLTQALGITAEELAEAAKE